MIIVPPLHLVLLGLALHPITDLDDRVLAQRIKEGDAAAFKAFFDRHHTLLYRYLQRRGVPGPVCEDLMQNAFLAIWERRDQIDVHQSLRSYLFKTCYNRALNHFRDTAKFANPENLNEPTPHPTPEAQTGYALMQDTLLQAVQMLPERRRAVFELCFLEELTYREAAEVLGISIKTVENQMGQALKSIRKVMEPFRG